MSKLLRRILAASVVATLLVSSLAACGEKKDPAGGTDDSGSEKSTVLTWYYPDEQNLHTDIVWDAINEYTKDKIGVEVDPKISTWGDYTTKTNTVMSSGQDYDIMFQSATYVNAVTSGATQPINEYLDTVGKEMKDALPESLWKSVTIDGKIHGVPTYKDNASVSGIVYNKTLADEIGMVMPEEFDVKSIEAYDALIREAQAKMDATFGAGHDYIVTKHAERFLTFDDLGSRLAVTNIKGFDTFASVGDGEVFSIYNQPETLANYQTIRTWVEDGIIPMDCTNFDTDNALRNSGKRLLEPTLGYVSFPSNGWSDDFETVFIPGSESFMSTTYASFGVNVIGAKSKNVEKSVEFLNLVNTDNFVANTIRFGVEGEYHTITEDNRVSVEGTLNADPSSRAYYRWYGWQFGNLFAMSLPELESDTLWEDIQAANENAIMSDSMGFIFDTSELVNEVTACTAVRTEFEVNLESGMSKDVVGSTQQLNDKLKASGIDKILAEAQKQLNEWRVEQGLPAFEG